MKTFEVKEACRLRKFTDFKYPQGAFYFDALMRKRDIKVNGVRADGDIMLAAGDVVTYYTTAAQESAVSHNAVYEDSNVFIADKYSGVTAEGLLSELNLRGEYFAVHRLDRNTRGLIVFAKNTQAERELLLAFRERRAEKIYLALCKDGFRSDYGKMRAYLLKDARSALVKIYDCPRAGAEEIVTEYSILRRMGELALVKIILHTGKTHQIRAHMAHIGCPVLGDEKYGDSRLNDKYSVRRQRLVAKYLKLFAGGSLAYLDGRLFESSFSPEE